MPGTEDSDVYTVAQAARKLMVNPSTIWRWIAANQLRAYRVGPRAIRIKKEDLDAVVRPAVQARDGAAQRLNLPFITADMKFYLRVASVPVVIWIGNYK